MALVVPACVGVSSSHEQLPFTLLSKLCCASYSAVMLPFICKTMCEPARSVVSSFVTSVMLGVSLSFC